MTYSIVARDADSGQLGVAVASHFLAVGGLCPWVAPEVGAVATQATVEVAYGPRMIDALRQSKSPESALRELTGADAMANIRQVAAVDALGRIAVHTGTDCIPVAGHRSGTGFCCQANMMRDEGVPEAMADAFASAKGPLVSRLLAALGRIAVHTGADCIPVAGHRSGDGFSCQANMMRDEGVPDAMADAFASTKGPLVSRLLAALDAAEAAGGDIRGRQSAAIKVVAGGPGGEMSGWLMDVRVDDDAEPLQELRRLVQLHDAYISPAPDAPARVAELGRGNPEGWFWYGVTCANEGRIEAAEAAFGHAFAAGDEWRQLLLRIPNMLPSDPDLQQRLARVGRS